MRERETEIERKRQTDRQTEGEKRVSDRGRYQTNQICNDKPLILIFRRDYQRALRLDPQCLPARINLAYTAQVSGKLMQAWRHFTAVIEVRPSECSPPCLNGSGLKVLSLTRLSERWSSPLISTFFTRKSSVKIIYLR